MTGPAALTGAQEQPFGARPAPRSPVRRNTGRTRWFLVGLFSCLVLAEAGPARAELVVGNVVVHGGKKTNASCLSTRMHLAPGDRVDFERLLDAEQRLHESNLFVRARVYLDLPRDEAARLMYLSEEKVPIDVQVEVDEKLSWFLAPTASFGSGDYAGGLAYADQNLYGRDLQFVAAGQLGMSTSYAFVGLRNPAVTGTALTYDINVLFRAEKIRFFEGHHLVLQVPTTVVGGQANVGWMLTPHLRTSLGFSGRQQWVAAPEIVDRNVALPAYNSRSGDIFLFVFQALYDNTVAPEGLQSGVRLLLKDEVSDRYWGSSFDYSKAEARVELYGHHGWHYPSLLLGAVLDYPSSEHGVPLTEMLRVGGPSLRGYLLNEFHGDTLLSAQIEDQALLWRDLPVPWTQTRWNLAAAAFVDFAALLERHPGGTTAAPATSPARSTSSLAGSFHPSVGLGLRVILPGIAIPALKLDVGYGIDVHDYAVTFSIAGGRF